MTGLLASLATVFLIVGAARYVMANGDPMRLEKAKSAISSAVIGYAFALFAPVLITIIQHESVGYSGTPPHRVAILVVGHVALRGGATAAGSDPRHIRCANSTDCGGHDDAWDPGGTGPADDRYAVRAAAAGQR